MGEVDMQRQALNVARMRFLGAKVVGVTAGQRHAERSRRMKRCATG